MTEADFLHNQVKKTRDDFAILSNDLELAVLGSILNYPKKAMPEALMRLQEKDFFIPWNRSVFTACKDIYAETNTVDPVLVAQKFGADNGTARETMIEASNTVISSANYSHYIDELARASRLFEVRGGVDNLVGYIDEGYSFEECREQVADLLKCFDMKEKRGVTSLEQAVDDFWENKDKEHQYIKTGFKGLDRLAHVRNGNYVIVGARSSTGKTALTLQMAYHMAKNHKVVYFSLETGISTLTERLISHSTQTSLSDMKTQRVPDWDRRKAKLQEMKNRKLTLVEAGGYTVAQIRAEAIRLEADVIFIDYLGLIRTTGNSQYEKVTNISLDLHTMAQTLNIPVFALVQLNRASEHEKPSMTSLRDSGQIEQDADVIMLLSNVDKDEIDKTRKLLDVVKNKEGRLKGLAYTFAGDTQTFTELPMPNTSRSEVIEQ